ncbi:MAG: hypothetical protein H0U83_01945 [Sphingomonas sp.]|nr:hypothetical protein [Sphingomonas sp.]
MNRRHLLRASALFAASYSLAHPIDVALARQTPEATPHAPQDLEDQPVDSRARELVARLAELSPLAVLEALESGEVTEPALTGAAAAVTARPWNDPLDTDLEHALGGVLIVASDHPLNSPELVTLGAYIVFESPEIAYMVLSRQLEEMEDAGSMTVAGTKAWLNSSDGIQLAIMRLGYVLVIAEISMTEPGAAEGLVDHLDSVTGAML